MPVVAPNIESVSVIVKIGTGNNEVPGNRVEFDSRCVERELGERNGLRGRAVVFDFSKQIDRISRQRECPGTRVEQKAAEVIPRGVVVIRVETGASCKIQINSRAHRR